MVTNSTQIFVSHSSKDTKLIDLITLGFKGRTFVPFFARRVMTGKNPVQKIINAIDDSMALFALITPNLVYDSHTRDWVVFEIAVAKVKDVPIFCWIDEGVAKNKMYPLLIENITDYDTFKYPYDEECYRVVGAMVDKAFVLGGKNLKAVEPTQKELKDGLIQIEEAKNLAIEYVKTKRKFNSITVNSIEPEGDLWIVKGHIVTTTKHGGGSADWIVKIKGKEVLSYEFKSRTGWAIL